MLEEVSIKGKVPSIGASAFYECSSLSKISIPDGTEDIGGYEGSFSKLVLGEQLVNINGGFSSPNLESVVIPSSVKYVRGIHSTSLSSVTIKKGERISFEGVGAGCFARCNSLLYLIIPRDNIVLGSSQGCANLSSITLRGCLESGGTWKGCPELKTIVSTCDYPTSLNSSNFPEALQTVCIPKGTTFLYKVAWGTTYNYLEMADLEVTGGGEAEFDGLTDKGFRYTVTPGLDYTVYLDGKKVKVSKNYSEGYFLIFKAI